MLVERAARGGQAAVIPDADGVLHAMRGYAAFFAGDVAGCAAEAPSFEEYAVEFGVTAVRAEAAVIWLGAGRLDKVAEMIGAFTPDVLADASPRQRLAARPAVRAGGCAGGRRPRDDDGRRSRCWHRMPGGRWSTRAPSCGTASPTTPWRGPTPCSATPTPAARHRAAALATYERIGAALVARPASHATAVPTRCRHGPQRRSTCTSSRAGCGLSVGKARRSCCPGCVASPPARPARRPDTDLPALTWSPARSSSRAAIDVLDDESRRFLGARLAELDAELADSDRPDLRDERDAIVSYLAGATGLGGRTRTTGSHAERARVAVRKAIVAALAKIAETDPWLGRHLRDRVRTGFACRYESDPDHPIRWILLSDSG